MIHLDVLFFTAGEIVNPYEAPEGDGVASPLEARNLSLFIAFLLVGKTTLQLNKTVLLTSQHGTYIRVYLSDTVSVSLNDWVHSPIAVPCVDAGVGVIALNVRDDLCQFM